MRLVRVVPSAWQFVRLTGAAVAVALLPQGAIAATTTSTSNAATQRVGSAIDAPEVEGQPQIPRESAPLEPDPDNIVPPPTPEEIREAEVRALRREVEQLNERLDAVERQRAAQEQREEQHDRKHANLYRRDDADRREQERDDQRARQERLELRRRLELGDRFRLVADFRYRFEHDWNSRFDDGTYRLDRFRMRYRLRLGFVANVTRNISFGAVARTGVPSNLQSPHVNVGYNGFGAAPFNLGRAYVRGDYKYLWWWLGKNRNPFWRQNELFWDDDVTPEGIAVGGTIPLHSAIDFNPTVAYFVPNHEQVLEYPDAHMVGGQLAFVVRAGELVTLDVASSAMHMHQLFLVPQHLGRELWDQGGPIGARRDYTFIVSGIRATVATGTLRYALPFSIGLDHSVNVQDYTNDDTVFDHHRDQKHMVVAQARFGHATRTGAGSSRGDWYVGYTYARKQELSVVSYYTEDDWVRWGNIHGNRNTGYQGHEIRAAFAVGPHVDLLARLYLVEALLPRLQNDAIARENGNRVRVEVNVHF
ncbi:MAG: putative porin [Myxococcota bacterium]